MSHPLSVRLSDATIARLGRHAQRMHFAPRTLAQRYVEEGRPGEVLRRVDPLLEGNYCRVVIAGGHGKIALLLERLLAERGDQAVD